MGHVKKIKNMQNVIIKFVGSKLFINDFAINKYLASLTKWISLYEYSIQYFYCHCQINKKMLFQNGHYLVSPIRTVHVIFGSNIRKPDV
jgi:hypothetical protein